MHDEQYEWALRTVLEGGRHTPDRTGTGATSRFGVMMRWDLMQGFPLITTKKVHLKSVIDELLWMLSGSTNVKDLQARGCTIWDEWAREGGSLGPVYGKQWRSWADNGEFGEQNSIDQITAAIDLLKKDPFSRRIIVSSWNVADLPEMALAPCHALFQFHVHPMTKHERCAFYSSGDGKLDDEFLDTKMSEMDALLDLRGVPKNKLSCQLYQRSADMFLGVPFNIASYALLTMMMAQQVNMVPGEFIWTGGNCHIYDNHREQVELQLSRSTFPYPKLLMMKKKDIFDYTNEDFLLLDYQHHPAIKAPVAV